MALLSSLSGCISPDLPRYTDGSPDMDVQEFFTGPVRAWGIVQDWRGRVVAKFDVDMVGTWNGDEGTLREVFTYYDGRTQHREWRLHRNSVSEFVGEADDIIGDANGAMNGDAMVLTYTMDVPVDGKTYRLNFDDWMWRMNDDVVINRSYMKKFGFTVAELTVFMQKVRE